MKQIFLWSIILSLVIFAGCTKEGKQTDVKTVYNENAGEGWWIKRNREHQTPEASHIADLSKYGAYYVDPKCGEKKYIYLTFDCGYENGYTAGMLNILKKYRVSAAFFVTKSFIRDNVQLVRRMKKEGHVVGNHTVHHKNMRLERDRDNKEEIIDCAQYCKSATGYDMDRFFRPPMGEYSQRTLKLIHHLGYKTIFWSIAYLDYDVSRQPGRQYVLKHFQENYHNGAIPLIHNVSKSNAQALEDVITFLKKKGFEFRSLKSLPNY